MEVYLINNLTRPVAFTAVAIQTAAPTPITGGSTPTAAARDLGAQVEHGGKGTRRQGHVILNSATSNQNKSYIYNYEETGDTQPGTVTSFVLSYYSSSLHSTFYSEKHTKKSNPQM